MLHGRSGYTVPGKGATGPFARLAIASLLDQGVQPSDIVAIARNPATLEELAVADSGVDVTIVEPGYLRTDFLTTDSLGLPVLTADG